LFVMSLVSVLSASLKPGVHTDYNSYSRRAAAWLVLVVLIILVDGALLVERTAAAEQVLRIALNGRGVLVGGARVLLQRVDRARLGSGQARVVQVALKLAEDALKSRLSRCPRVRGAVLRLRRFAVAAH
jgi:hypothetical protein